MELPALLPPTPTLAGSGGVEVEVADSWLGDDIQALWCMVPLNPAGTQMSGSPQASCHGPRSTRGLASPLSQSL